MFVFKLRVILEDIGYCGIHIMIGGYIQEGNTVSIVVEFESLLIMEVDLEIPIEL